MWLSRPCSFAPRAAPVVRCSLPGPAGVHDARMRADAGPGRTERALRAAVAVAAAGGVACREPVVLRDGSNLLVHLRPAQVVARVATATATVRAGDAWLA